VSAAGGVEEGGGRAAGAQPGAPSVASRMGRAAGRIRDPARPAVRAASRRLASCLRSCRQARGLCDPLACCRHATDHRSRLGLRARCSHPEKGIIRDVKDPRPGYSPREACIQGQLRLWRVSARRRERHGEASHLGFVNARRDGFPPNEGAERAPYGAVYDGDEEKMRAAIHTYIHWCGFLSWREARARLYRRAFVLLS
jgi:hypothetical protein